MLDYKSEFEINTDRILKNTPLVAAQSIKSKTAHKANLLARRVDSPKSNVTRTRGRRGYG